MPSQQMKQPIPDDWNNEQYICLKIKWPKSNQWLSILLGFLTTAMRGRYWDEKTGSIKYAQNIGRDIFDFNYPWNVIPCDDADIGDNSGTCGQGGIQVIGLEEIDMGAFVTDVTIEDGKLYIWYGRCCKILVGSLAVSDTSPGDVITDPSDPSDWPCNKAAGIAIMLNDIMQTGIPAITGLLSSQSMVSAWRGVLPQYAWGSEYLTLAMEWFFNSQSEISTVVLGATFEARIRCYFAPVLDKTNSISDAEFVSMKAALSQFDTLTQVFIGYLMESLTVLPFQWAARDYYQVSADCACPEANEPSEPTASGWYLSAKLPDITGNVPDSPDGLLYNFSYLCPEDIFGVVYEWEHVSGDAPDTYRPSEGDGSIPSDVVMFGPNSAFDTPGVYYMLAGSQAWEQLNVEFPSTRITIGNFSDTPASPVATASQYALASFWCHMPSGATATVKVKNVRFIMNVNSPSHS